MAPTAASQLSQGALGKRAQLGKCHPANRRFYERFLVLRSASESAGRSRQARGYAKVLQSLQRYPLPLLSSHDALGLEGVGKTVASIFGEVLEAAAESGEVPVLEEHDLKVWRVAACNRFVRALQQAGEHGGPGLCAAPRRSFHVNRTGHDSNCHQGRQADQVGPERQQNHKSPARSGGKKPPDRQPENQSPANLDFNKGPGKQSGHQSPAKLMGRKGRRLSLAIRGRRSFVGRRTAPSVGSNAWCVLVALGLYADEAPNGALSMCDIARSIDKLRRELPRCDTLRWRVLSTLVEQRLVEQLEDNKVRLTPMGREMAESLVTKLSIPMTALSPLRLTGSASQCIAPSQLGKHARNETEYAGSAPSLLKLKQADNAPAAFDSEDDIPLNLLHMSVGAVASPTRKRKQAVKPACHENNSKSDSLIAAPQKHELIHTIDLEAFEYQGQASCTLEGRNQGCQGSASAPSSPPKQRRRVLKATLSAPPPPTCNTNLHFDVLSPKRRLEPCNSEPAMPGDFLAPAAAAIGSPQLRKTPIGNARLVLLLDHREVGASREHKARGALLADLASHLGPEAVEARSLPLGDVLWLWREQDSHGSGAKDHGQQEFVAGWIIERKTLHDLSASVVDGRYDEQKSRLLEAPGLQGVIYLVEGSEPLFGVREQPSGPEGANRKGGKGTGKGFGQRLLHRALPLPSLSTTAVHTQLITGFHVLHTTSTSHTVAMLCALHRALQSHGPPGSGSSVTDLVAYREFAERTRKTCHSRVYEAFGRMLRMVPHCGPEATEALVDEFSTPRALAVALRDSTDADILKRLKARRGGRASVSAAALAACRELFVA